MDDARYDLENGPDIVRLTLTSTILSDTGTWRCDIRAVSSQDVVSNGSLVRQDPSVIGTPIVRGIQLIVIGKIFSNNAHWILRKTPWSACFETNSQSELCVSNK